MAYDVIFFAQYLALAGLIVAVKMLAQRLLATERILALQIRGHLTQILQILLVLQKGIQAAGRAQTNNALALITGGRRRQQRVTLCQGRAQCGLIIDAGDDIVRGVRWLLDGRVLQCIEHRTNGLLN